MSNFLDFQKIKKDEILRDIQMCRMLDWLTNFFFVFQVYIDFKNLAVETSDFEPRAFWFTGLRLDREVGCFLSQ